VGAAQSRACLLVVKSIGRVELLDEYKLLGLKRNLLSRGNRTAKRHGNVRCMPSTDSSGHSKNGKERGDNGG